MSRFRAEEARAVIRSSHRIRLLRRLLIGALAALTPLVAGCAAGTSAATFQYHEASNGAYATVGPVNVINAFVLGPAIGGTLPAGSPASLFLSLYNGSSTADKLVSVTAPGTATVTGTPVAIPAGRAVYLTGPQPKLILTHLTRPVKGGELITLVLNFQAAGSVTIQAPVEPRTSYYATYSPPPPVAPTAAPAARSGRPGVAGTPAPSPSTPSPSSPSPSPTPTG